MEIRKGYKKTEIGEYPENWNICKLSDIATLERGKFSARPRNDPKYYGGNIPFIQTGDVTNSNGDISSYSQTLNSEGLKVSKLFSKGTLFFTIAANIGDVGFATFDTACPDSLVAIMPNNQIDKKWLFQELQKRKKIFESLATQNAQLNINLEKLRPYLIPVPSLPEQQAIAAALNDVDSLLTALDSLIAKKRLIKQGAMQELLTGKRRLSGFRDKWKPRTMDEMFQFLNTANNSRSELATSGTINYIHYGDIHTKWRTFLDCDKEVMPFIDENKVRNILLLEDGDLIVADASEDYGGLGVSVEIKNIGDRKVVAGLHTLVLRGNKEIVADGFKGYLQYIPELKNAIIKAAVGISVYGISKNNLKGISISLPDVPEQTAIAEILSDMDAEITALESRREKTRLLKQGMMSELLTGRIRLV